MLPLPFLPQGDVQASVTLWGKNMLPASQQHYPTTVMISSIIPSNPKPTTGMVPAATVLTPLSNQDLPGCACQRVLVCACVR